MVKLSIFLCGLFLITSIYSITVTDIDGGQINFSEFQGKKILIVNTASNSRYVSQYGELQQLHQAYGDSVVIIAFPSNSFDNEPMTNAEIKAFCQNNYNVTFKIAQKASVAGANVQSIYNWLAQQSENGVMNGVVVTDFQKFLIDENGLLIGVFAPSINPLHNSITNALTNN